MNFGQLQAYVKSFMGDRDDYPAYVFDLTNADINRDFRLLEMQSETTLSASAESVSLPADFLELESIYCESGGERWQLVPMTEGAQAVHWNSSARPVYYAVHNGEVTLMPVPDGTYTLTVRYYASLDTPTADGDENAVMTTYPTLYLYGAATHAALWMGDTERTQTANAAYTSAVQQTKLADKRRRMAGGPLLSRSVYTL